MMQRLFLNCGLWLICATRILAAVEPGEILPQGMKYSDQIPTPAEYLGFKIGERHLYHHELVGYLERLAVVSDRVTIREYARSYGGRRLVMVFITSPGNHAQLESIQRGHTQLADPQTSPDVDLDSLPAVINMGYSIHGNEPSAGNAAALVAYYLAAGTGREHDELLEDVVVLLDPCLNPDGFERFAHWANNHRGQVLNSDPNHREHHESWPNGRTNYYWFDLNRDWLPAQHPESRGRVAMFHHWKPNVVLDFHEMGTDATYFFQPGVPQRNHPLTPRRTVELTREFATFHAGALDEVGSLYYTEERFDDYYMGKGSTYPDLHGSIGILFEQASARGHVQESVNGPLTFSFAIRNHFLTSLSSLRATMAHRPQLLEHKRIFYQDAAALARNDKSAGYVVAAPGDPSRLHHFLEVLSRHQIQAFRLRADLQVAEFTFHRDESFFIPTNQPEFRFLKALFERRTEFAENIFYDVSTWTLPLAFNVLHAEVKTPPTQEQLGEPFSLDRPPTHALKTKSQDLAYVIDWANYYAPSALYALLDADVKVKVAEQPFQLDVAGEEKTFDHGTLLVPLGIQPEKRAAVVEVVQRASQRGVRVYAAHTGLTSSGIDLGSSDFVLVPKPKALLVTGVGVSGYEAGEIWHLLDQRMDIPITMVEGHRLGGVDLRDYSTVIMASGSYDSCSAMAVQRLKEFASGGGTIVAIGSAIRWIHNTKLAEVAFRTPPGDKTKDTAARPARRPYADASRDAAERLVRGSIFLTHVDHTHPLGYGYAGSETLPVFRNNTIILEPSRNAYSTPLVYDQEPLLSGYVSTENLELLSGSASVVVQPLERGRLILIAENPNFRAFWYGTNRVFCNALFFGPIIRVP